MKVLQGRSMSPMAARAVAEAADGWSGTPDIIFAFCSSQQVPTEVAAALKARWGAVPVVGGTTAGEFLGGAHTTGSLVLAGLVDSGVRWATTLVEDVSRFDAATARRVAAGLLAALGLDESAAFDPEELFCLTFIDGLSMMEEKVVALLADELAGVRIAGGSSGDDLMFERTWVFHDGQARSNAAVIVLGQSVTTEVEIVKHQHFVTTPSRLVITRADTDARVVYEMDGYPATVAYAAALGLELEALTSDVSFLHPLVFECDGQLYVRSIQSLNDDQSITFYCAIEPGMVVSIGGHEEMTEALARQLDTLERADFMLGFNCILRSLEANAKACHHGLSDVLSRRCGGMIGFDTYGEQLDGLHINQTLVAVTFNSRQPDAGRPQ